MIKAHLPCSAGTSKNHVGTSYSGHVYYKINGFFYKKIEGAGLGGDCGCYLKLAYPPPPEIQALEQVAETAN